MYPSGRDVRTPTRYVCPWTLPSPALNQNVTKFSATHLHITSKAALSSRIQVLDAIAQLRSLSAQTKGGDYEAAKDAKITHARSSIATWHIRRGVAMSAKAAP